VSTSGIIASPFVTTVASVFAVGVLVLAWLALWRDAAGLTRRTVVQTLVCWAVPLAAARPLFSGDVWSYLAQGLTAARGMDPYRLGPIQALGPDSIVTHHVSPYWVDTPAPYGPAWLITSRVVGEIAGDELVLSVLLYRAIALIGVVLIGWALPRLARRVGASPTYALWLGLLNPLVLWHLVAGAHNDAIMLGAMLAGLELALVGLHGRKTNDARTFVAAQVCHLTAGVTLLAVAASVKIVAGAAICCLAVEASRRRSGSVRLAMIIVSGATTVVVLLSLAGGFGWLVALRSSTSVYSWMSPTTVTGLVVGALTGAHATATAVMIANMVGAAVCVPLVIRLLLNVYRARIHPLRALGLIFATVLLCGPVVQPWYLLWALLPLAATAQRPRERSVLAAVSGGAALAVPALAAPPTALIAGYLLALAMLAAVGILAVRLRRMPPVFDRRLFLDTPGGRPLRLINPAAVRGVHPLRTAPASTLRTQRLPSLWRTSLDRP
jgi:alpha-1,6-mannosyltransferase